MRFALLCGILFSALPSARIQDLPEMTLEVQWLDGNPQDLAVPSIETGTEDQRGWGAQGRRRAAWRVSDGTRFLDEEDFGFGNALRDVAIDEADELLFTLTLRSEQQLETGSIVHPATIRTANIADPTAPQTFLPDYEFAPEDRPQRIAISPDQDVLLVTLPTELRVIDYSDPTDLDEIAFADPGLPISTGCSLPDPGPFATTLARSKIVKINPASGERTVALVMAITPEDETVCSPIKPQPTSLLVCDITDKNNPFFYTAANQIWQPCRTGSFPCEDWRVNDFAHLRVGSQDLVYAVGGPQVGIQELDITNIATTGIIPNGPLPFFSTPDHLIRIHIDPDAPTNSDYFYLLGRAQAHVVERTTGTSASTHFGFGKGPAGDTPFVLGAAGERQIWSLASVNASYIRRVTDFTQTSAPGLEAPTSEGYYAAGPTDGGVLHQDWDSVYLPTFGGVVRYDVSGSTPIPIDSSYQPAGTGINSNTVEHMELFDLSLGLPGSGDWHLVAPTADGGVFIWPVDPTSYDPQVGTHYMPPPTYWSTSHYGNDVALATSPIKGAKWIAVDYSDGEGPIEIGFINWHAPTGPSWSPAPIHYPTPPSTSTITGLVWDLAFYENWLLVGAEGGFLIIDMASMSVIEEVFIGAGEVGGATFDAVHGIEMFQDPVSSKHRIVASLGYKGLGGTRGFGVALYEFDPLLGSVVDPATGSASGLPFQSLLDGDAGDDVHGPLLGEGDRLSVVQYGTPIVNTRVYVGASSGHVVELEYGTDNRLSPLSYWGNGNYFEEIMDCNSYFSLEPVIIDGTTVSYDPVVRVLVAKRSETFEIIRGYGF